MEAPKINYDMLAPVTPTSELVAEHTKCLKRIAELERKVQRMKAEAQLCRQDVGRDRERALDRIVEIAMAE